MNSMGETIRSRRHKYASVRSSSRIGPRQFFVNFRQGASNYPSLLDVKIVSALARINRKNTLPFLRAPPQLERRSADAGRAQPQTTKAYSTFSAHGPRVYAISYSHFEIYSRAFVFFRLVPGRLLACPGNDMPRLFARSETANQFQHLPIINEQLQFFRWQASRSIRKSGSRFSAPLRKPTAYIPIVFLGRTNCDALAKPAFR